jgi:hypothetical protein
MTRTSGAAEAATEYKFSEGFLMREEWRGDWSTQPYFLSSTLGLLKTTKTPQPLAWFGGLERRKASGNAEALEELRQAGP